jgi:hypothetical protein
VCSAGSANHSDRSPGRTRLRAADLAGQLRRRDALPGRAQDRENGSLANIADAPANAPRTDTHNLQVVCGTIPVCGPCVKVATVGQLGVSKWTLRSRSARNRGAERDSKTRS